jgi:DNA gyrase subunit A
VNEVSVIGRNTQGVRLIKLTEGELLVSVEPVADSSESSEDAAGAEPAAGPADDAPVAE